ncbi:hypothetical protein C8R47DRAFT_1166278 [Mycena vitilis]|nr:hypothetical protein C8R47DRAFT_1166278 [Mycena vitilis]
MSIKPIDKSSIHRITSGQVVIDLQTAVKELVENSLDAGATNLEVRFKQYGLSAVEVIDNGGGISEENYQGLALKHHTSKLSSFADLTTVTTFGFRGEALSSLCALCGSVVVSTATQPPMGVTLDMDSSGKVRHKGKAARQRGTTITLTNLFTTLPVRRKEFERNAKREFGKALTLLNAYALGPCSSRSGVRLTVSNQADKGQKSVQIRTPGTPSLRDSVSAIWGPKALDNIVPLDLNFYVERDKLAMKRAPETDTAPMQVVVRGLISKFAVGCGRTGTDRQFLYVNGRPCNLSKVQKAFNEVYRSFNATQAPFIVADFILPTDSCDINVSPDKRSILLHHEANLIAALRTTLEATFASSRSTYDVEGTQQKLMTQKVLPAEQALSKRKEAVVVVDSDEDGDEDQEKDSGTADGSGSEKDVEMQLVDSSPKHSTPKTPSPAQVALKTPSPVEVALKTRSPAEVQLAPKSSGPVEGSLRAGVKASSFTLKTIPRVETSVHQTGDSPFLAPVSVQAAGKPTPASPASSGAVPPAPRAIEPPTPAPAPSTPSQDVVVEFDAAHPSWQQKLQAARKLQLARKMPDDLEPESTPVPSNETAARKKRRSEPEREPDTPASPVKTQSAGQSLRTMLSGFSRPGSQAVSQADLDDEGEDELESSGDEEVPEVPPPNRRRTPTKKACLDSDDEDPDVEMQVDSDVPSPVKCSAPTRRNSGDTDVEMETGTGPADAAPAIAPDDEDFFTSNPDRDEEVADKILIIEPKPKPVIPRADSSVIDLTDDDLFETSELSVLALETSSSVTPSSDEVVSRPEVIRTADDTSGGVSLRFDLSKISDLWRRLRESHAAASTRRQAAAASTKVLLDAGIAEAISDDIATEALDRTISKEDFGAMEILGQFNLGFIIARRRKDEMDDLFIVDQHAADEKYNFETLQQTTRIKSQKLFRSQPLELTAGDELLALENLEVLRQNGFEVETGAECATQSPRLSLTAQPISKDTVFDMKDLEELIHRMRDQPTGQMVRCSKARAMFAMRACRKSVMIGMPLARGQMTAVVRHMGTMDQPWNCPHGRPTMRHLADVSREKDSRVVHWASFCG